MLWVAFAGGLCVGGCCGVGGGVDWLLACVAGGSRFGSVLVIPFFSLSGWVGRTFVFVLFLNLGKVFDVIYATVFGSVNGVPPAQVDWKSIDKCSVQVFNCFHTGKPPYSELAKDVVSFLTSVHAAVITMAEDNTAPAVDGGGASGSGGGTVPTSTQLVVGQPGCWENFGDIGQTLQLNMQFIMEERGWVNSLVQFCDKEFHAACNSPSKMHKVVAKVVKYQESYRSIERVLLDHLDKAIVRSIEVEQIMGVLQSELNLIFNEQWSRFAFIMQVACNWPMMDQLWNISKVSGADVEKLSEGMSWFSHPDPYTIHLPWLPSF